MRCENQRSLGSVHLAWRRFPQKHLKIAIGRWEEVTFGSHSRIVFCCEKLMTLILDVQMANPMSRGGRPNTPLHWAWAGQPSLPGQVLAHGLLKHGRFHPLIPKNCVNLLFRGFHSSFLCPTTQSGDENRCGAHVRGCAAASHPTRAHRMWVCGRAA